jgi:hypothetical protein
MKQIHKEMLCLSTAYLDIYVTNEDNIVDSDIKELYDFCRTEVYFTVCNTNQELALQHTDSIHSKIQLATIGEDVEVNVLAFALQACFVLVEDDVFKLSKNMKLNRLTRDIYSKLEKSVGFDEAMKNSVMIICKVIDNEQSMIDKFLINKKDGKWQI